MDESLIVVPVALHAENFDIQKKGTDLIPIIEQELEFQREKNLLLEQLVLEARGKNAGLENLISNKIKPEIPRVASYGAVTSASSAWEEEVQIGTLTPYERAQKILRYKEKVKRYKQKMGVSRKFSGRSLAASNRVRLNGKFVKEDLVN